MNYRRITGRWCGWSRLRLARTTARAQEDLGDSIANTVSGSVSSVATNSGSGGTVTGGESVEHSEVNLGEQTGSPCGCERRQQ